MRAIVGDAGRDGTRRGRGLRAGPVLQLDA
jgi:hypothetical protein